jgi:CheY-like chemotaxis protein
MNRPVALIIDDNKTNLQIMAGLLGREGLDHIAVIDSRLTTHVIQDLERLQIVFLDLEMPVLSGYDVLSLLQADQRFAAVPIVAYTVHVSESAEAFHRGFHSFLAKPIDPDQFPAQLARILHGERVWAR